MNSSNRKRSPLRLTTETIRTLDSRDLGGVAAGKWLESIPFKCPWFAPVIKD